jgi:SAM-dependent methyltransferase
MREQGFSNTDGFELNRRSADVARECYDLELITDTQSLPLEKYDLVVLIEVVEHLADPVSVLEDIKPHIKPGGRMLITTDSVRNFVSRQFPAYSSHFTGPSHISLFTEQAMSAMLGKIGFEVEKIETSKSVETFDYLIASPFYTLDFLSPQSESETSDLLLVPSGFGKMLGLEPVRTMPLPLRALRKIDHLITSAMGRFAPDLSTEGMTVLARKK